MGTVETTDTTTSERAQDMSRRDFMSLSWRILGAAVLGQAAYAGLRFLSSREAEGTFGGVVIAGVLNDFPPGTVTPFEKERFFLVRFEDGGFLALYAKCTHLACIVAWDETRERFICPCHGSEFELAGSVVNPPAPRPLDRFSVSIEEDLVKVDTGAIIQRSTTGPGDLIYAPFTPELTPDDAPAGTPTPDSTPASTAPADNATPAPPPDGIVPGEPMPPETGIVS